MQKYLRILNLRLDAVVNDICGLTGMAIITDICKGNLDPEKLSGHRHGNCRKSKEEIAKALKGNNREDYLLGLKQELDSCQFCQKKIAGCDKQIRAFLKQQINTDPSGSVGVRSFSFRTSFLPPSGGRYYPINLNHTALKLTKEEFEKIMGTGKKTPKEKNIFIQLCTIESRAKELYR